MRRELLPRELLPLELLPLELLPRELLPLELLPLELLPLELLPRAEKSYRNRMPSFGEFIGRHQSSQARPDDNNDLWRTTPPNPRLTAALQLRYRQMQSGHS